MLPAEVASFLIFAETVAAINSSVIERMEINSFIVWDTIALYSLCRKGLLRAATIQRKVMDVFAMDVLQVLMRFRILQPLVRKNVKMRVTNQEY